MVNDLTRYICRYKVAADPLHFLPLAPLCPHCLDLSARGPELYEHFYCSRKISNT